jgi:hypothetical protein
LALLELFDAGVNVLSKKLLHSLTQMVLPVLLDIWNASKSNNLACVDIKSCPKDLEPVTCVCFPNEIKVLLPVNQLSLAHRRLAQCQHDSVIVLANRRVEVELAPNLVLVHSDDIFVPDLLLLEQPVPFVNLGISADQPCKFFFHLQKLLFVHLSVILGILLLKHLLVKNTRCEVLRVENSHFFLVYENKEQALVQEKALVNRETVADVEAIKLEIWLDSNLVFVSPDSQLYHLAPGDGEHRVSLISVCWRQPDSPVQVWNCLRIDVVWLLD